MIAYIMVTVIDETYEVRKEVKCTKPHPGKKLIYAKADIKVRLDDIVGYIYYVICPLCDEKVTVPHG